MKARKLSNARSTALCALMLTASACSTVQPPRPTARVPANLLASPAQLPSVQRTDAGTMTGGQCLGGLLSLYDIAGQIRATLIDLQRAVRAGACGGED